LGRSRGGFSTKIHVLCDDHGHPLNFHLTAGQAHETTDLVPLLEDAEEGSSTLTASRSRGPLPWLAMKGMGLTGSKST
jgi:transposase